MIDLLRIRVSQYRQDRILAELFSGKPDLVQELKELKYQRDHGSGESLFRSFEELRSSDGKAGQQMYAAQQALLRRLRRDTDAILHLQVRNLEQLFGAETSRTSFQNALLTYLLYCCGGFAPSDEPEKVLVKRFGISPEDVVRRHGTERINQLARLLPADAFAHLKVVVEDPLTSPKQSGDRLWPGGYLGFPGPTSGMNDLPDEIRQRWRKEYLPEATAVIPETLCGSVAGIIQSLRPDATHFRVTLHRALPLHGDDLLQQACNYKGRGLRSGDNTDTAARIFPTAAATIGLAYRTRRIVRSKKGVSPHSLVSAMKKLELPNAARKMMPGVRYLLAVPVLEPADRFVGPNPVSSVLYLDSKDEDFWLHDADVQSIVSVLDNGAADVWSAGGSRGGLSNMPLADLATRSTPPEPSADNVSGELELVAVDVPQSQSPHSLNFDYNDFAAWSDS